VRLRGSQNGAMAALENVEIADLDHARRVANARGIGAVTAAVALVFSVYRAVFDGDPPAALAVGLACADTFLIAHKLARTHVTAASIILVAAPIILGPSLTAVRGQMFLSPVWSALGPMFAGLLFRPRGVLITFGFAAAAVVLTLAALGEAQAVQSIPNPVVTLVALGFTLFSGMVGALASSSTMRALLAARQHEADALAERGAQHLRLLEANEQERRAIARELHDDFGQLLTALRFVLQSDGSRAAPDAATELVDQAIVKVRNLALALRPTALDELGLHEALRSFVARQGDRTGIDVQIDICGQKGRLPARIENACFRVAQEAFTNIARHARARSVRVELLTSAAEVSLSVRDDGRGFDVAQARARAAQGASVGVLGMEERVSLAGGRLELLSAAGAGTTVRARFPLPAGAA
jgi:signal transduction histidine kinase